MERLKEVNIYTDGACLGNPGPGGYAAVMKYGTRQKEVFGGYRLTTNNRMEVTAAIVALENLKERCSVRLHTDSKYLAESMTQGWAQRWKFKNWVKGTRQRNNADLWQRMLQLCTVHDVSFVWIRGHSGDALNERCDVLSLRGAQAKELPADMAFEQSYAGAKSQRCAPTANFNM
ncbi:MAG: ribonuclease HI [Verrucomicrobia bacterium]|nr:MAG: ribonuclease HI [Verrucomicrobiota bacterium]